MFIVVATKTPVDPTSQRTAPSAVRVRAPATRQRFAQAATAHRTSFCSRRQFVVQQSTRHVMPKSDAPARAPRAPRTLGAMVCNAAVQWVNVIISSTVRMDAVRRIRSRATRPPVAARPVNAKTKAGAPDRARLALAIRQRAQTLLVAHNRPLTRRVLCARLATALATARRGFAPNQTGRFASRPMAIATSTTRVMVRARPVLKSSDQPPTFATRRMTTAATSKPALARPRIALRARFARTHTFVVLR
jgi:hypothetical protein